EGDHDRLPAGRARRPAGQRVLRIAVHHWRSPRRAARRERRDRPGHRRAELRLLGRQRAAGRRAVVGGIGFAGVVAFIFADLIVLPIILIYRKYYGTAFTLRIVALMLITMIAAALIIDGLFSVA